MKPLVEEIEALVARAGTHPVWGYRHCLRVFAMAEDLAKSERVEYEKEVLRLSALLHDIGLYKAYNLRGGDHARRSAAVAGRLLRDGDYPIERTRTVVDAVLHHPPGVPMGNSIEADLLKDAVALDYLGAIGFSRVLAMVGLEEEVPDMPAAVRHARSLHRGLPDALILPSSRDVARNRVVEMEDFLYDLTTATKDLELL